MKFKNVYFINGTAYAGKSTMVKLLAEKYNGIACEENYQNIHLSLLDKKEFPALTYTRDLKDWRQFIRRTPDEYETWIKNVTKECTIIELEILEELSKQNKLIFVDTNIPVSILKEISDIDHVLIMLAKPYLSVNRFFERPDKEKQFLYQLLLEEDNVELAMENFKNCLKRINSSEVYNNFLNSGFNVVKRDDNRTIEETVTLLQRKDIDDRLKVRFDLENLPLVKEETKATYQEIKDYIYSKYNVKVSTLNIAQTKTKYGIIERECYNKPKDDDSRQPKCTREKEEMIIDALKHFKML